MTTLLDPTVGSELKKLREARSLSQNKLSGLARVSGAALSRWESGQRVPSIPELEAVLTALDASDAQKRAILRRINAPRALVKLRAIDTAGVESYASGGGPLLWAMRKRRGWTQTETARAAGVTQSQIARWEHGASWPDDKNLHMLCWVLGARAEEVAALTGGAIPGGGWGTLAPNAEMVRWDEGQWADFVGTLLKHPLPEALTDLTLIQAEQQLAQLAHQHAFAAKLLPSVYALHARHHFFNRRDEESVKWAEQGLALLKPREWMREVPSENAPFWFGNVLTVVGHAAKNKRPAALRRGAALLRNYLPALQQIRERKGVSAAVRDSAAAHFAWGQMHLANVMRLLGHTDESLRLAQQACQSAERIKPAEAFMRWRDYGRLLHNLGESARALDASATAQSMVQWEKEAPDTQARQYLAQAMYLTALNDTTNAGERIREAERIINRAHLRYLEPDLQFLARKCA